MKILVMKYAKPLCAAILYLWTCPAQTPAAEIPWQSDRDRPVTQGSIVSANGKTAGSNPDERQSSSREKHHELEKRITQTTIDDLNLSLSLAAEDIDKLDRLINAITPLEPPKREYDIGNLREWYYRYSDLNRDMIDEYRDHLELLSVNDEDPERLSSLYAELARHHDDAEKELKVMTDKLDDELERLFRIIDRRQLLNERLLLLQEQLSLIEEKIRGRQVPPSEKAGDEAKAERLRNQLRIVQTELISLYDIKEELLKHYVVLIEMGRDESFWLDLKRGEYESLENASRLIGLKVSRHLTELEDAYRRLIRSHESEIRRISRKVEDLDRKRSRVSPAGSFRDLDRSRELSDFYLDRQRRYSDYINRLKVRIGSFEADLSEILSRKKH